MSNSNTSRTALGWLVVLLILFVTAWFGWKALNDAKPEEAQSGPGGGRPPSTVIVRPAEFQEIVETLKVTGTLRAVRRAEVAARESAAVDSISVEEGDLVKDGALLVTLDPRRLEAQLQEASAGLTSAKADLAQRDAEFDRAVQNEEMMRNLWDQRAVAEREYLDSVREMKVAEARSNASREMIEASKKRLDLLEVRKADLKVTAPFAGRVVARHSELGEWVSEGASVVTLISTGEAEAWLQLPERHARLLRGASPESVQLRLPGSDESIQADKLTVIPDVDGRSRRFTVIAHIPDPKNLLTPGSSVTAIVPLGVPQKRMVVPTDAILTSFAGSFVFVPDMSGNGPPMAKRVNVNVLFERNGEAVLAEGELKVGDDVIVEGNERLFPGTPLDPQPWSETRGKNAEGSEKTAQAK